MTFRRSKGGDDSSQKKRVGVSYFLRNTIDFDSLKSVYTLDNFEMNHIEGFHIKYGQSKTKSRFTNTAKSTALSMG